MSSLAFRSLLKPWKHCISHTKIRITRYASHARCPMSTMTYLWQCGNSLFLLQSNKNLLMVDVEEVTDISEEHQRAIKSLWEDKGIQRCFDRRNEFQISDSAKLLVQDSTCVYIYNRSCSAENCYPLVPSLLPLSKAILTVWMSFVSQPTFQQLRMCFGFVYQPLELWSTHFRWGRRWFSSESYGCMTNQASAELVARFTMTIVTLVGWLMLEVRGQRDESGSTALKV